MGKVIVFFLYWEWIQLDLPVFFAGMSNVSIIHDIILPCCVLRGVQAFYWGKRWGKSLSCCFAGKVIMYHYVIYVHPVVSWGCATCRINKPWKQLQLRVKTIGMSNKIRSNAKIIVGCQIIHKQTSLPATKSPVGRFDLPFTFPLPPKESSLLICRLKHIGGGPWNRDT